MKLTLILTSALVGGILAPAAAFSETKMLNGCEIYQHPQGHWLRADPDCDLGVTGGSSSVDLRGVLALLPKKDESPSDPVDPEEPTDPVDPPDEEPPVDDPPVDEPPADEPPADDPPSDEPPAEDHPADDEGPLGGATW